MIENPMAYKNELLKKHSVGEISLAELEKECAYWFAETFDTLHLMAVPTAPQDFYDYQKLPFEKRNKIGNDFWNQPNIKFYTEQKQKIKEENRARLIQLYEMKSHIPAGDFVTRSKFDEKIVEFTDPQY